MVGRAWTHGTDTAWADDDFWLFDDQTPVLLRYDQRGRFLGARQASDRDAYLSASRRVLALSVDLTAFTL